VIDEPVLRLVRVIARLNVGGPSIQAITLTDRLQARGYDTTLVRGVEAPSEGNMDALASELGVIPLRVPSLRRDPGRHDVTALRAMVRILRHRRPRILHTHAAKAGTIGRAASLLASADAPRRRPVRVHTYHGHSLTGYFSPRTAEAYRRIERALARHTDRLIAVSPEVRDELVALDVAPPEKFVVIPLGFDLSRFTVAEDERASGRAALRAAFGIPAEATVLTLVARLVPIKRVDRFLGAAAAISEEVPGLRVVIVGDGELRGALRSSPEARALGDRLTWTGFRRDIDAVCFASDVVALTSDNEGTPVSLIEASAAGVPVVSTRVGGAASVVREGVTGLLVEPDDGRALADGIRRLLTEADLRRRLGAAAREHATARFGLERLVDDVDRLYRDLLGAR
jgi:glycosyltransferase involved in cell wall biosynthesis